MASRRLSKSFSAAIKAHNAFSRPSLRSRAFSADAYFSSIAFPNSFTFRPNSYIGVSRNGITSVTQAVACGQLLPHSFQFPYPRGFSAKANKLGFTEMACQVLLKAVDVARVLKQQTVESEHLMKALLEDKDGRARKIFAKAGIDNSSVLLATANFISTQVKVRDDIPTLGSSIDNILTNAKMYTEEFEDDNVSVEHLLLAFYSDKRFGEEFLKTLKLDEKSLKDAIKSLRVTDESNETKKKETDQTLKDDVKADEKALAGDVEAAPVIQKATVQSSQSKKEKTDQSQATQVEPQVKYEALEKYGNDLTEMARQGKLDPVIGRNDEIRRCIGILCRRMKSNPVIVGEPGVGKTAIAEGLAQRIIRGDVPEHLYNRKLISLDVGSLLAGAIYTGQLEERLEAIMKEVAASNGKIILFIDEIHSLARAASNNGDMLKIMLGRGDLRCIGATTLSEYRKYIEKDPALERRFQKVLCDQPSVQNTISILRGLRERYELHHGVRISDGSLVSAAVLADRYITERFLPDKAIDLVDEAAANMKMEITSKPTELDEIETDVITLEMEKLSLIKDTDKASKERLQKIENDLTTLNDKQKEFTEKWETENSLVTEIRSFKEEIDRRNQYIEADKYETLVFLHRKLEEAEKDLTNFRASGESLFREEVTHLDIAEVVSKWTGIPLSNLEKSEREKLVMLDQVLHERVVGQDMAVESVADAIRCSKAGLSDPNRPIASFMFMGPTGVGKTELAKALAGYLFDTENAIVRIDMSEYMESVSVTRLIGASPGYVGYSEGGQLTEAVRRRPYSVVLFDEIEKAHPDVFNVLLQLLDDGRITDSHGRKVSFKNCFIIMTSNIGSHHILETIRNNGDSKSKEAVYETMKRQVVELARKTFRPEFMNRIDEFIVFQPLDSTEISKIVEFQMRRVKNRLEQNKINLEYTKEALSLLAQLGFDPNNGARPVKRVIEKIVKKEIALKVLKGEFSEDDTILLDVDQPNNKLVIKKLENNIADFVEEMAA